ncbi:MAG: DUF4349 domain-containing protein [Chloroflexi bacterium]|nr:DUF4349 domain-containing protein [Chloroflexota bacterium]
MIRPAISQRLLITVLILIAAIVVACSSNDDSFESNAAMFDSSGPAGSPGAAGESVSGDEAFVTQERGTSVSPQAQPASDPAPSLIRESSKGAQLADFGEDAAVSGDGAANTRLDSQIASAATERIIVRTVDVDIVVPDVSVAISQISDLAIRLGGWVVSSQQIESHTARVSIRVPSNRIDEALKDVKGAAIEVESERLTSQDFTEEFTDISARIETMQLTLDSLKVLFDRADKIQDAIAIQVEMTRIQADKDALQARVNFLMESSSFSLINVDMSTEPAGIEINAGTDQGPAIGSIARFRAQFNAPEGIEDFVITWDFGDGSPEIRVSRVIATEDPNVLISAPVTHTYFDDEESPYVVTAKITGSGPAGLAEGEDKLIATVSRIPTIEVYAGENFTVESGDKTEFQGSFTRPAGLKNLTYSWDFGDGFSQEPIVLPDGVTAATATHKYENFRPTPFTAVLTVRGDSLAGPAEATGRVSLIVTDPSSSSLTDLSFGNTGKNAGMALLIAGSVLLNILIYALVFAPFVIVVGLVWWFFFRTRSRRTPDPKPSGDVPYSTPEPNE